jgi:hypothetical protein
MSSFHILRSWSVYGEPCIKCYMQYATCSSIMQKNEKAVVFQLDGIVVREIRHWKYTNEWWIQNNVQCPTMGRLWSWFVVGLRVLSDSKQIESTVNSEELKSESERNEKKKQVQSFPFHLIVSLIVWHAFYSLLCALLAFNFALLFSRKEVLVSSRVFLCGDCVFVSSTECWGTHMYSSSTHLKTQPIAGIEPECLRTGDSSRLFIPKWV